MSFGSINRTEYGGGLGTLNDAILFPAPDGKSAFQFGGETSWLPDSWVPPDVWLGQFILDGRANGSWSKWNSGGSSGFVNITRPARSLGAVVDDTLFMVGGQANSHSSQGTIYSINGGDTVAIGGIFSFNMSSGLFANDTVPPHLVRTGGKNGMLASTPGFGSSGLLLAAGTGTVDNDAPNFKNITIYNPTDKTWHYQDSSGAVPSGRDGVCTVGIQGDDNTYKIFMYGGHLDLTGGNLTPHLLDENKDLDAVYVLSLPAFTWFRADYPPVNPRFSHTCHVVGNRQMLSIGGVNPLDANGAKTSQDTATHGLQIFDLTEMKWSDRYDANAAPYKTPQVIKEWYQANGTDSVQWQDPTVQQYFLRSLPPGSPPPSNTSDSGSTSSSNHTGAIVGGVIGGIAGICLLAALVFLLLRRRKQRSTPPPPSMAQPYSDNEGYRKPELSDDERRFEADSGHRPPEADGMQRSELDANGFPHRS